MKKIRLRNGAQYRDITPIFKDTVAELGEDISGHIHVAGAGYTELTTDITCVLGFPTLGFTKNGVVHYIKERQPLPDITGVMIYPDEEIAGMITSYRPPSLADIFNSWTRIGNNNGYYPSGTTPTGEAAAWQWMGSYARCTVNSSRITGFISTDTFEQYDSSVIMSSSDADDDYLIFVMAYKRENNVNKLFAVSVDRQPSISKANILNCSTITDGVVATHHVKPSSGGWSGAKCKIRVIRDGTVFKIYVSPITTGSPVLNPTPLTIDTLDYPNLSWVSGPMPYGYACYSQNSSTFSNLDFRSSSNDTTVIYNADTGDVWDWIGSSWVKHATDKAWDRLGHPRKITSVDGIRYQILEGSITRI